MTEGVHQSVILMMLGNILMSDLKRTLAFYVAVVFIIQSQVLYAQEIHETELGDAKHTAITFVELEEFGYSRVQWLLADGQASHGQGNSIAVWYPDLGRVLIDTSHGQCLPPNTCDTLRLLLCPSL
jgi:hypothetical protein